jgi:inosose dehydratase
MPSSITRRSFLGTLGAAAAMSAAVRAQPGRRAYRIGIETYCFHDVDLAATIAHTKSLGLGHMEIHDGHLPRDASPADLGRAKRALAAAALKPDGVYIHDAFTESEAVARPIFEYAKTMGFTYINGGPKPEALPVLNRLVPEYGIQIAIHNHGPGARYETIEHVTSALDAQPNIRACVDIGHFARAKMDPVGAIRAIGRRAVAVHIKDVDPAGENVVVGEGTIDMPGVFAALAETGFDGLMVLEYEGDFDDMTRRMDGMRRSLAAMSKIIASAR